MTLLIGARISIAFTSVSAVLPPRLPWLTDTHIARQTRLYLVHERPPGVSSASRTIDFVGACSAGSVQVPPAAPHSVGEARCFDRAAARPCATRAKLTPVDFG